jgi:hypothetical protein
MITLRDYLDKGVLFEKIKVVEHPVFIWEYVNKKIVNLRDSTINDRSTVQLVVQTYYGLDKKTVEKINASEFIIAYLDESEEYRFCIIPYNFVPNKPLEGVHEKVDHPIHYGGKDNPYEAIKVIEAWDLGFNLGNTLKYISRAGIKSGAILEDLKKAAWYLNYEIKKLEKDENN